MTVKMMAWYNPTSYAQRKSISSERSEVGQDRPVASTTATESQGRPSSYQRSALFRGNSLDPAYRGPVERIAQNVWQRLHMLATTQGVGREWNLAEAVASIPRRSQRSREAFLGSVFRGWEFCSSKKGGREVGKTKKGKGTKWMVLVDGKGTPLGARLSSASPAEVRLAERLEPEISGTPDRLIADRAYDSNRFRAYCVQQGMEPIVPARTTNTRATHQDGRRLRGYRRRWIVERTFSWIGWCRRLVVRWERLIEMYYGFFVLACAMITLRRVLK